MYEYLNTCLLQDRAGVSKGYGFVTFETEEEARRLQVGYYILFRHATTNHLFDPYCSISQDGGQSVIIIFKYTKCEESFQLHVYVCH